MQSLTSFIAGDSTSAEYTALKTWHERPSVIAEKFLGTGQHFGLGMALGPVVHTPSIFAEMFLHPCS